jgi:hypothetical protein
MRRATCQNHSLSGSKWGSTFDHVIKNSLVNNVKKSELSFKNSLMDMKKTNFALGEHDKDNMKATSMMKLTSDPAPE